MSRLTYCLVALLVVAVPWIRTTTPTKETTSPARKAGQRRLLTTAIRRRHVVDVWRQPTVLPQPVTRPAVALGLDGNIYVFGGGGISLVSNKTYIYHPITNTWSQGSDMPTAREGAQAVTLRDGRIAVLGGGRSRSGSGCHTELCQDGTVFSTVEAYNPRSNRWSRLASLQSPRYRFAAVVYHGRIYALGGSNGSATLSRVETYDPRRNRWTYSAPLPQAEEALTAAVDRAGHIDVMGGYNGSSAMSGYNGSSVTPTFYNDLFIYDGSAWTSGAPLPQAAEDARATPGRDGRVYVIGGFNAGDLTMVQAYNPVTNKWSFVMPLPSARCCIGATTDLKGRIYALGGDGPTGLVDVYGPS